MRYYWCSMAGLLRNKHHEFDPVWHVQIAMVVAIVLQLSLPDRYSVGSHYGIALIELLLIILLSLTTPKEKIFRSLARRVNVILLIGVTSLANVYALSKVAHLLLSKASVANGRDLVFAALNIYLTNIIIIGLWYWEMDGGGPGRRREIKKHEHDFLFPQNQNESYMHPKWQPTFIDYLYVSSTNAMAFSPTDTMPLTRRAKLLMLAQAAVSLITIALVAARAVNVLS